MRSLYPLIGFGLLLPAAVRGTTASAQVSRPQEGKWVVVEREIGIAVDIGLSIKSDIYASLTSAQGEFPWWGKPACFRVHNAGTHPCYVAGAEIGQGGFDVALSKIEPGQSRSFNLSDIYLQKGQTIRYRHVAFKYWVPAKEAPVDAYTQRQQEERQAYLQSAQDNLQALHQALAPFHRAYSAGWSGYGKGLNGYGALLQRFNALARQQKSSGFDAALSSFKASSDTLQQEVARLTQQSAPPAASTGGNTRLTGKETIAHGSVRRSFLQVNGHEYPQTERFDSGTLGSAANAYETALGLQAEMEGGAPTWMRGTESDWSEALQKCISEIESQLTPEQAAWVVGALGDKSRAAGRLRSKASQYTPPQPVARPTATAAAAAPLAPDVARQAAQAASTLLTRLPAPQGAFSNLDAAPAPLRPQLATLLRSVERGAALPVSSLCAPGFRYVDTDEHALGLTEFQSSLQSGATAARLIVTGVQSQGESTTLDCQLLRAPAGAAPQTQLCRQIWSSAGGKWLLTEMRELPDPAVVAARAARAAEEARQKQERYESLLAQARNALKNEQFPVAETAAREASRVYEQPPSGAALSLLGESLYRQDKLDEAKKTLESALPALTGETRQQAEALLGKVEERRKVQGILAEAEENAKSGLRARAAAGYSQAYRQAPSLTDVGMKAANLWADLGEFGECARIVGRLSGDKAHPDAQQLAQTLSKRYEKEFQKVERDWLEQGSLLLWSDQPDKALLVLQDALNAFPKDTDPARALALAYVHKGDIARACTYFQEMFKRSEGKGEVRSILWPSVCLDFVTRAEAKSLCESEAFRNLVRDALGSAALEQVPAQALAVNAFNENPTFNYGLKIGEMGVPEVRRKTNRGYDFQKLLHSACLYSSPQTVEAIITVLKEQNKLDQPTLGEAVVTCVYQGLHADSLKVLLKYGADINYGSGQALTNVARFQFGDAGNEAVKTLLSLGAKADVVLPNGSTILLESFYYSAERLGPRDRLKMIMTLVEAGANVNAAGPSGRPLDHLIQTAIGKGLPMQAIQLMLDKGADPTLVTQNGNQSLNAMSSLLSWCDPRKPELFDDITSVARLLLEHGIKAHDKAPGQERYWIQSAVYSSNIPLARLLLESGAKTNVKTSNGYSIREFAENNSTPEMVELIKKYK